VLGALLLMEGGSDEQKRALLPTVASGERVLALAVTEADYGWSREFVQARAEHTGDGLTLNGTKLYVHNAMEATDLIVAARQDGGVALVIVEADAPGVSRRPLSGFATGLAEVRLEGVEVGEDAVLGAGHGDGWEVLEHVLTRALPVLSAYQVGGLTRVFDVTLAYSRTRRQFEQPIGRFQRVQDHVIDIVNYLDAARWTTYEALWLVDSGREHEASVHMAAAVASEGYYLGCNAAHDVHAGVGIMREYGLTLHTKMSRTLYHYLGDPRFHRRRIARALSLAV
jgi:alkylation response protein AidB-like acyl-CoA dehydrogenase